MDSTYYMGLFDDSFFSEILHLCKSLDKHKLLFLKDNPHIMDRFKKMVYSGCISCDDGHSMDAQTYINIYDLYVALSNVFDVNYNPSKYDGMDRFNIYDKYRFLCGDFKGVALFSNDERDVIDHVIDSYKLSKELKNMNEIVIEYQNKYSSITLLLKKVLEIYFVHGESAKFYSILFDDMNIKQEYFSNIVKYTKSLFYQSLCSGRNIISKDILVDFSVNEIYLLDRIDRNYFKLFDDYKFEVCDDNSSSSDYENLFKLFDQIDTFLSRNKGVEYTVGYVSNDLKISLYDLENYYYSVFKKYCNYKLQDIECKSELKDTIDNRVLRFSDLNNFNSVMEMYRKLVSESMYLRDLLCSNISDMNNLVNMIYSIKYFNQVTPSMNYYYFESIIRFLNQEDMKKCESFILGYNNYYKQLMHTEKYR